MTDPGEQSTTFPPDWYPDPTGRYEFRYHNGSAWTADVSTDGERFVDVLGGTSSPPAVSGLHPGEPGGRGSGNGIAVAALTCGILSIAFGWLPVLFVVGAVLAVLAVVFGTLGLRRSRRVDAGRGMSIAGIVTGALGVVTAVGGLVFTIAVFRALERYENPAEHTAEVTSCEVSDSTAQVEGTVRNDSDRAATFTVRVDLERPGSGLRVSTIRVELVDVDPGETRSWDVRRAVRTDEIVCGAPDVSGPLPFGVDPG